MSYLSYSKRHIEYFVCSLRQKGPNKHHILEALSTLGVFTRMQRKKINLAAAERKQRNATAATSQAGSSNSNAGQPLTNRNKTRTTQDSSRYSSRPQFPKIPGGMEDVD